MDTITNREIRDAARIANVPLWQVAHGLGIAAETFSRKLRFELDDDEKRRCLDVIEKLSEGQT